MNKRKELTILNSLGATSNINPERLVSLIEAAEVFLSHLEFEIKMRGKKTTLTLFKQIYHIAKCVAMNEQFKPLPFRKSDKLGIPRLLKGMVPFLLGSTDEKRLALTVTRSFESIMLKPEPDFEPILRETKVGDTKFIEDFTIFLDEWIPNLLRSSGSKRFAYHMSNVKEMSPNRSGPNGPGLATSHYDAWLVKNTPNIYNAIKALVPALTLRIDGISQLVVGSKDWILSRIAVLPQPGGKSRIIAIGDYWSQLTLKPIHNDVMSLLKKMMTDGTYSQDKQSERICQEAGNQSSSFDLSNATDTFPLSIQKMVMERLYNPFVADNWEQLISKRQFLYKPTRENIEWKTGQPLGLYSSWAVFAITHHAVIEFCALKEGIKSFRQYAVLGDDVVIWNKKVSDRYEVVMEMLSVKINRTKTLLSDESNVRVEFAKRLFYNHVEISGLSWHLLQQSGKNIGMFISLLRVASARNWEIKWENFRAPGYLSNKGIQLLNILLWEYSSGTQPITGVVYDKESAQEVIPDLEKVRLEVAKLRLDSLKSKMEGLQDVLAGNKSLQESFSKGGITVSPQLLTQGRVMHPLMYTLNDVTQLCENSCYDIEQYIQEMEDLQEGQDPPVLPIEFFPSMHISTYFGDNQRLASMFRSNMVLKAYFSLYSISKPSSV